MKKVEDKLTTRISKLPFMEVKFEIGWVDNPVEGKANKGGPKRSNGKGKNNIKPLNGPAKRNGETKEENKKSPKRGS